MAVPAFPSAAEARRSEGTLQAPGGPVLHWERYTPPSPRSTVMVLHGAGDHLGRYPGITSALVRAGHEVALVDFRGHGRSGGRRWFVDRFEDYLADLDAFAAKVRTESGGRKIFVVAHSQGGHIAAHWALRGGRDVAGVVLSNPYVRLAIDPPKLKTWGALLAGKIVPHLPVDAELDLATLTSDPEMQAWTDADPLYLRKTTPRWFTESGRAQEDLRRGMARFDRPLLLLLGTGDRIADGAAASEFFAAVSSKDKTLKEYVGFEHEIFNERGRDAPIADAVAWITARSGTGTV
ncbi:MAG TPA: alpha/beta hydrolase [Anaeromyxobacteraceae bacterium]|nr:alpha/beta hydrolase [Anaeromyxobacteraceae bacterium]